MKGPTNPLIAPVLYVVTVLYMVMIFYVSGLTSIDQPGPLGDLPSVDKLEHAAEFMVLGLLLFLSFHYTSYSHVRGHAWSLALIVAMVYAVTDELHQTFVPGRNADLLDLLVDVAGISVAVLVGIWVSERRQWHSRGASTNGAVIRKNADESEE